jgi:Zn-finger nucleic acid-binding protein
VLIPHETFVELFGGQQVDLIDDTPTERVCPCCDRKMRSCRIAIDKVELDHDTLYCKRDGVWLAGGLLEHILFATERESHRDFPGETASHLGPGMFDSERQAAYETRVQLVRDWLQYAYLGFGVLIALCAVAAAGWWCIITTAVIAMVARWWWFRQPAVELGLVFRRPLTYVTVPVRSTPYRFRLPR